MKALSYFLPHSSSGCAAAAASQSASSDPLSSEELQQFPVLVTEDHFSFFNIKYEDMHRHSDWPHIKKCDVSMNAPPPCSDTYTLLTDPVLVAMETIQ